MKFRNKLAACITLLVLLAASQAAARSASIVFWYPGEAGSTEDAQPIIDEFFSYLSKKLGDVTIHGRYYNSVNGGLQYIARRRPAVGIVSYAALTQYRDKLGGPSVIMATLPLPGGKATERYALVGRVKKLKPGAVLLSSEPLKKSFVKQHLFSELPGDAIITPTEQIFSGLKRIAAGELDAYAILTPIEAATLAKLKSPWAKELVVIERSESVPTARVLLFDPAWSDTQKLKRILADAGRDPEAKEILLELRLKGFENLK